MVCTRIIKSWQQALVFGHYCWVVSLKMVPFGQVFLAVILLRQGFALRCYVANEIRLLKNEAL